MGDRWLTDLAQVLRDAGLVVHEERRWQTNARSSGGYTAGLPDHVVVHHTASGPNSDPLGDVAYIAHNADTAPISNLYLSRSGEVWVIAAGACNHAGSGWSTWEGGPPDDQMNTHSIGIEAANGGTGEVWPIAQQDAYLAICRALCGAYEIDVDHVRAHWEWTPDGRKIDPAGPSLWASGAASWDMGDFRADLALAPPPEPVPLPPVGGDMSTVLVLEDAREPFPRYRCGPAVKSWVTDGNALAQIELRLAESAGGTRPAVDGFTYTYMRHGGDDVIASYGPIVGPIPPQRDTYGRISNAP